MAVGILTKNKPALVDLIRQTVQMDDRTTFNAIMETLVEAQDIARNTPARVLEAAEA